MSARDANRNAVWLDETKVFPELISHLLTEGHTARFSAPGDSMYPTICDGDMITVAPVQTASVTAGDIILYRHRSGVAAHRVKRIIKPSEGPSRNAHYDSQNLSSSETLQLILRGDAAVVYDDPVGVDRILGKVILVERDGRCINPYSLKATLRFNARRMAARFKKSICFQT
jgi:signal peptidase I